MTVYKPESKSSTDDLIYASPESGRQAEDLTHAPTELKREVEKPTQVLPATTHVLSDYGITSEPCCASGSPKIAIMPTGPSAAHPTLILMKHERGRNKVRGCSFPLLS